MKKNVYLAVITVVTIILIIVGVAWNLSPLAGISLPWQHSENKEAEKGTKVTKVWDEQELGDCNAVNIELSAADLKMEKGDRCEIRFEGNEKLMPEVKAENGYWTLTQKQKRIVNFHDLSDSNRIVITVPEGIVPELVKVDVDAGDLKIQGIQVQTMDIQADAGDIDLEGTGTQNLKLDLDAGDIDIADTSFTEGKIDADMGDLSMKNVTFTDLAAEMDAGNVDIHSAVPLDEAEMNLEVDLGDIRVNGQSSRRSFHQQGSSGVRLSVTADLGDVKVTW